MNGRLRQCRPSSRRGVTLLEVVLAVVLLTLIASSLMGAIVFVSSTEDRNARRIAAHEVCNSLILQFLDNQDGMPSKNLPIEYDRYMFRWDMATENVEMQFSEEEMAARGSRPMMTDRYQLLIFRVWPVEDGDDHYIAPPGEEMAVLSRLYDPIQFSDNPDRKERLTEADIGRMSERIMGGLGSGGGAGGRGGGGGGGGPTPTPGPTPRAPKAPKDKGG